MDFQFATANRIVFGCGSIRQLPALCSGLGKRVFFVTGRDSSRISRILKQLTDSELVCSLFPAAGEPTVELASRALEQARAERCDMVVALGGGSAMDLGKAVSALLTNPGKLDDYLALTGPARELMSPAAPCIAAPTTAGTGSEVTKNAVLGASQYGLKISMRSALMLPRVALVDPELTYSLPPGITASSGMDALTQLIEPFVSLQANPLTDGFCREGIARAARSLARAFENGNDAAAREDMCIASLCGGLALTNAKLGAVHGLAGVIGGMLDIPHGLACARLLPFVVEANITALIERRSSREILSRFLELAQTLCSSRDAGLMDSPCFIRELCGKLQIPGLASYNMTNKDLPLIADKALSTPSMQGNPVGLKQRDLILILEKAL